MAEKNYYLHKNKKTEELLYLEYDKIKGYPITPKTNIEDAIIVNKIVFVNPSFSKKIIKKKIDIKLKKILKLLEELEANPNGTDEGEIQKTIMDAERLRINIINTYIKYLGNTYASYTVNTLQIMIDQLKIKLYQKINQQKFYQNYEDLYYLENDEEQRKGRGR